MRRATLSWPMPAHIRSALTQTQLGIPLADGRLALGTWQAVYLFRAPKCLPYPAPRAALDRRLSGAPRTTACPVSDSLDRCRGGVVVAMIVLFTDFGLEGPYVGQIKAVLHREAPGVPVVDLFHDAPAHAPELAAYLLAAYVGEFPEDAVFLCVVDPGVGSGRRPVMVRADDRWYVGPDNGLLAIVARRARSHGWWDITIRPRRLSATFHGRDLFAPAAARLARGGQPPGDRRDATAGLGAAGLGADWPDDLARIVYIDRFGNAITGLRVAALGDGDNLAVGERVLTRARTFSEAPPGEPFWYENSSGLATIAVDRGRADEALSLALGDPVVVRDG